MRDYGLDGGDSAVSTPDLQLNSASATTAASITSKDSYSITIENLPVKLNGNYNFVFQYYYENPDKTQITPILGPTSATYSVAPTIQDLSTAPTNVVATGGFYSYQLKWDTPTFLSYGDTIVYENTSNSFNSSSKVVYVGTANQCTILTSDLVPKYVYVVHRDMFLDANKKGTVVGPIVTQDPITVDTVGPENVSSVTVTASLDLAGPIGFHGHATISWPAVTGNGIRGYRIRWREVATPAIPYSYVDSPGIETMYHLSGLGVGLTYEFAVATYDEYNNTSTQYVAGNNITITGTPYIAGTVDVSGFFRAKANPTDADSTAFKFGYGVDTGKRGLVFNSSNYWYIDSNQSALLKVGGSTSNYLLWDGSKLTIDGDINAKGGSFSGNILMSTSNASIYNGTINAAGNLTGNGFALNSTGLKVANGTNSVTIDAANGRIIANAGTIGGWSLTDSLLNQNNARLSSTGYIELGGTSTDNIIRLDANDATYRMWIGRNSSTTAPFKVTKEGILYAIGAVLTNLEIGSTLSDGTSLTTVKTNAATGATALQPGGTLTGNVSGTVGGIAVSTVTSGASSGASAIQPGNGVTLKNDKTIESIIAGTTLTLKSGGAKPVIINDAGLKMNDGTQDTLFLDASSGSAVFRGTVYASAGEFSGKVTAGSGKIGDWTISADGYLSSSDTFFYPSTTPGGNASTYSFITTRGIGAYSAVIGDPLNTATTTALTIKGATGINGNLAVVGGSITNGSQGISSLGTVSAGVGGFTTLSTLFVGQGAEFNSTVYANTLGVYTGTSAYAVRQVYAGGSGTNATGYLRVNTSSRKFKKEIEPLIQGKYLDLLTSLKPVSYLDRNEDAESPRAFGLIAEEVAEIPELKAGLVPRDADGNPGAVHYELVGVLGVMALKEIKEILIKINSRLDALEA